MVSNFGLPSLNNKETHENLCEGLGSIWGGSIETTPIMKLDKFVYSSFLRFYAQMLHTLILAFFILIL